MNLFGIQTTARINYSLATAMGVVIAIFFVMAAHFVSIHPHHGVQFFTRPFYDPETFNLRAVLGGTSVAVLTYIGFDGISTLSEEAKNPRRDILRATVLVCLITGALAACEVYAAQLVWPPHKPFPDVVTAFVHVAGLAGGTWLLQLVNATLLVATIGSGMGSQIGAARLLYAMGRGNAIPRKFFGAIEMKRRIPRNNVLFSGALALAGALTISFARGVDLLNFGALIAFMGVNAASLTHYYVRSKNGGWKDLIPPVLGFGVCFLLWWSLNPVAKIAGSLWMAAGLAYGAYRTRGFRGELVSFDIPEDEE
jgi:amino acid transporter